MNTCIHHPVLAKSCISGGLGLFTVTCFFIAKHFPRIVSHKYLLTTLCFLCFSKLHILLMIECFLDAFPLVSLMGVSPWEFSKRTFFFLQWRLMVYHNLMETVTFQQGLPGMSHFLPPGRLLHSCTGSMLFQGKQQPDVPLHINNSPYRILKMVSHISRFQEFKQKGASEI